MQERENIDQLMTHIIAKLADNDKEKIDNLTANPLDVPSESKGCYQNTVEAFSKVCIDLEIVGLYSFNLRK